MKEPNYKLWQNIETPQALAALILSVERLNIKIYKLICDDQEAENDVLALNNHILKLHNNITNAPQDKILKQRKIDFLEILQSIINDDEDKNEYDNLWRTRTSRAHPKIIHERPIQATNQTRKPVNGSPVTYTKSKRDNTKHEKRKQNKIKDSTPAISIETLACFPAATLFKEVKNKEYKVNKWDNLDLKLKFDLNSINKISISAFQEKLHDSDTITHWLDRLEQLYKNNKPKHGFCSSWLNFFNKKPAGFLNNPYKYVKNKYGIKTAQKDLTPIQKLWVLKKYANTHPNTHTADCLNGVFKEQPLIPTTSTHPTK